jgi:hypothetical protein
MMQIQTRQRNEALVHARLMTGTARTPRAHLTRTFAALAVACAALVLCVSASAASVPNLVWSTKQDDEHALIDTWTVSV